MKLTRLELSGFKSFADTVSLSFESGVTAIVGPNGCGKSNVSDAVRWVLGEQSARLLRGGKMEDVIFQGSAARRPVNLTQVSLYLDNSESDLPIAYQEVVITRRLSRSGQSEYLINDAPVRLRDVQDLLRGTGLGSDAGVVIEAKMIDLLLSDRAGERRSLFEEAAGIGLYRDRKHSTERRLEETGADLQRLEDLMSEVQSQIRSLARQKGKAERHAKLREEKFAVQVTLARRLLDELGEQTAGLERRRDELQHELPALRAHLADDTATHDRLARDRTAAESHRSALANELAHAQVALGKLEGDLAVAGERLGNMATRRRHAEEELEQIGTRLRDASLEREAAAADRQAAEAEHQTIQAELAARSVAEDEVRQQLGALRATVRQMEQEAHDLTQRISNLEGERTALEAELLSLRNRAAQAAARRDALTTERSGAAEHVALAEHGAAREAARAAAAVAEAELTRHRVAEGREHEARVRAARRQAEETLAQVVARQQALEELERDRVGLAPAAAALLAARDRFGEGAVLGPLSDFVSAPRADAELAERLLGEWAHAILVRDATVVDAITAWHASAQPGAIILLPVTPGPSPISTSPAGLERLRAESPARAWADAILAGSEALDPSGRVLRRAVGAIYLTGAPSPTGPLRRRAELEDLRQDITRGEAALAAATADLNQAVADLQTWETRATEAADTVEQARSAERQAQAARDDAARHLANLERELAEVDAEDHRLRERIQESEARLAAADAELTAKELRRAEVDEALVASRGTLATLEAAQEAAREARTHWQVQEAHVGARLRAAAERGARADRTAADANSAGHRIRDELQRLTADSASLEGQRTQWEEDRRERGEICQSLDGALREAEHALHAVTGDLTAVEQRLGDLRASVDLLAEEQHRLDLELAEVAASRRSILERIATEWKAPLDQLEGRVPLLDLDRETLEAESARIVEALEAIGPVNPLAVEEHAEEVKRLEFLTAQRDDLVSARQALLQAIREIDGTARAMFEETFTAIQTNFQTVFHTLFGGGECDLRLATPEDPLESEIEIHAAPRGKRTQRIHLLSSGERTLVAVSLLFSIYLTKPSPFCLMDEVDAPLDDANVGRFTTLLSEFKPQTQFLVITHNPRTMQAADSVYGVTMQEPGVSTIVGVRLGEHAHAGAA